MGLTEIIPKAVEYLMSRKKLLQDDIGVSYLNGWKEIKKENIVTVNDFMLPEVLRIQAEGFENGSQEKIQKYLKKFKKVFYIIKDKDRIVGFCIYYLKPSFSFKGFKKQAVISSIAIEKGSRGKGLAEKILTHTIEEMKINNIQSILLYVNVNNLPARKLYEKIGFQTRKEIRNICGRGQMCYEMELKLI